MTGTSPLCKCHQEANMRFERDSRYTNGGFWRCRIRSAERSRARYGRLSGVAYSRLLLKRRRNKAITRMRKRAA